jgi:hypothetical protein
MKNFIICLLFTTPFIISTAHAQNMAINTDGSLPDASAMVDIKSTSKGLLAPRMTTTQQNAIVSPANGLLIFNTTDNLLRVNTGTPSAPVWTALGAAPNNWLLTGNAGSNPATNFLGTTDDKKMTLKSNGQSFLEFGRRQTLGLTQSYPDYTDNDEKVTYISSAIQFEAPNASFYKPKMFTDANGNFRVKGSSAGTDFFEFGSTGTSNNGGFEFIIGDDGDEPILFKSYHYLNGMSEIMRLQSGRMAVGSNSFNATNPEKLLIDAGATSSYNLMTGKGSINNYLQVNVQNLSNGTNASSDVVATANNGDETTNYIDMGINGGGNTSNIMGGANDGYLYTMGNNFLLGTGNASKSLVFMTGGTSQAANERMRIDGNGNVGIGVTNPVYKLQVSAASNPLHLTGLQTGSNADSILTISNGVVKRLNVSALTTSSSNAWALVGNASTNPSNNFIGTLDAQPLVIKENNTQVGRFEANSVALGNAATTNNSTHSYSFGSTATVAFNKTAAMALGNNAAVNGDSSFAIGTAAVTNGVNSFAIGNGATSNNTNSFAIGRNAVTAYSITDAIAIGTNATSNYSNAIAIGSNTTAAGKTVANAASAVSLGTAAVSNSTNAIAIGTNASTGFNLTNPITIGYGSLVNGNNGVALGNGASVGFVANTTVLGAGASASNTAANSTAIGYNTNITKADEIILGDMTNTALSVGIGSENFSSANKEKLLVDAGVTTSVNAIAGKGSIDSYLQLNIQNNSAGTSASSDVVATANNGNETSNYVDMGINGGNYSGGVMGAANDGYLYTMGNNFLLGTGNASKSLVFMTGGTSQATNERMRIDGTGNVGIGNTAPTQKVDITGNLRLSGAFMPNNSAGSPGYFLQSVGAGAAPAWVDAYPYLSSLAWMQNGNSVSAVKSLGTTTNFDLPFITNNTEKMRIATNGDVGIGTASFNSTNPEQLVVDAGTTTSVNAIVGKGSINSYLQLNIQNNSSGTNASSDVVATANNGDETSNYIDMGINGGGNTNNIMGGANDGYLYTMGNNFLLGTGNSAKSLVFMTGGTSQATNERMRIDGTGNVGIGVTNPAYKLQVSAAANPLQLTGLQTGTNTDSVLTISNGVVKRLSPSSLTTSSSNAWGLTGNAGTATTKLGTTNNFSLPLITNNTTKMTISADGNIGIGSTNFDGAQPEKLLVDAGTTATNNLIGAYGDLNGYVQIGVQNRNSGNSASSDIVATADNGTNTTNYIDMGINSSSYANNNSNLLNRPNIGYLYSNATADFFIGNGATNQDMVFFTNSGSAGTVTANGNEAMRIDASGNVGIGGTFRNVSGTATTNPEKLVVQGNVVPRTSGSGTLGTSTYKWNAVYATNGTIQTSDKRMKTNITDLNYGLKEILAMRPVSFNWKTTPDTNKKVGLIAQEIKAIVPEVVTGDEAKESLGLNYAELVPVLINAVKEQQKEITELRKMVEELKNRK